MSKKKNKVIKKISWYHRIGISAEKDYFIDSLSMMLGSGMGMEEALSGIESGVKSKNMKIVISYIKRKVGAGVPLWRALKETAIFPDRVVTLLKIGEESGVLKENLKVVGITQQKERSFKSKIKAALIYPVFVFGLTIVVGVGVAWFILPRLANVFRQLDVDTPFITDLLIQFGVYLQNNGAVAIPMMTGILVCVFYIIFINKDGKFIGQYIIWSIPGVNQLIIETEIARFGFILGTLLESGLSLVESVKSLEDASAMYSHKKMYKHLRTDIKKGVSIENSFKSYKSSPKLIPRPLQEMVFAASKSGNLSNTFVEIGNIYEEKTDTTMKNVSVVLEPVLLVVVASGVFFVALSVILPLYSLIGNLNG